MLGCLQLSSARLFIPLPLISVSCTFIACLKCRQIFCQIITHMGLQNVTHSCQWSFHGSTSYAWPLLFTFISTLFSSELHPSCQITHKAVYIILGLVELASSIPSKLIYRSVPRLLMQMVWYRPSNDPTPHVLIFYINQLSCGWDTIPKTPNLRRKCII